MNYTKEERLQNVHDIIRVVNSMIKCDPEALDKYVKMRVPCNSVLADHPTMQVRTEKVSNALGAAVLVEQHSFNIIGFLNALAGCDEHGQAYIAGYFTEDGTLERVGLNLNLGRPR